MLTNLIPKCVLLSSLGLLACTAAKSVDDIPVSDAGGLPDRTAPAFDAASDDDLGSTPDEDAGRPDAAVARDMDARDEDAGSRSSYRDAVLASSPIAYWPFDETAGSTSTDVVGGRVLQVSGSIAMSEPSLVAGGGDAVGFGGAGWLAMSAPDSSLQHLSYSVELWVRATSGATDDVPFFVGGRDSPSNGYQIAHHRPLGLLTADQGTGGEWLSMRSPFAIETTYHVVLTYDAAVARLYVGGSVVASASGAFLPSTRPLVVGADSTVAGRYPLHGVIDELAYYDRALDSAEIAGHYDAGRMP